MEIYLCRLLGNVINLELEMEKILLNYMDCDDTKILSLEEYLYESFRWLRMVSKLNSVNRVRGELVKTYYHVPEESLEAKLRRNGSVIIEAEDILHFPPHYIASKPGQLMSADLCEGQEPSIVTASMFPSALSELVPSCISQVGVLAGIKSVFRLLKRHLYHLKYICGACDIVSNILCPGSNCYCRITRSNRWYTCYCYRKYNI